MNAAQRGYHMLGTVTLSALLSWPAQAVQEAPSAESTIVDIRGIWKETKLDKEGAAARGLVASEIQTPRKTKNVAPRYPHEAMQKGIQGTVYLECTIDTAGVPTECKVTRDPMLDEEALRCVKQWRYKPLTVRGHPAPALVDLTATFRMR